jgi:hypothetical protein
MCGPVTPNPGVKSTRPLNSLNLYLDEFSSLESGGYHAESVNGLFSVRLPDPLVLGRQHTSQRERRHEVLEVENLAVGRLALD